MGHLDDLVKKQQEILEEGLPPSSITDVLEKPVEIITDEIEAPKKYLHFGKEVKLGSRVVKLLQVKKFSLLPKGEQAKTIRAEQVKKVGSQWRRGTRDIIRGLSEEEENFYMPKILGIAASHSEWNDRLTEFWANYSVLVPYGDTESDGGLDLEVGFRVTGVRVEPINLKSYMSFNFCKENSDVAITDKELENTFNKIFYIIDKAKNAVNEEEKFVRMKSINRIFNQLISSTSVNDKQKIAWILETSGGQNREGINVTQLSDVQREMWLERLKEDSPEEFYKIVTDTHLETKALIRTAVELGHLDLEGNSYFLGGKVIGSNLMDTVGYFNNPANQKDKLIIVERIKSSKE